MSQWFQIDKMNFINLKDMGLITRGLKNSKYAIYISIQNIEQKNYTYVFNEYGSKKARDDKFDELVQVFVNNPQTQLHQVQNELQQELQQIKALRQELTNIVQYSPGGSGYQIVESNFETRKIENDNSNN